jgi:cation:H+ antiporter
MRLSGIHPDPVLAALIYGIGIVGGAFLLSWGAEAAQVDVSASLAIAVLALVAILPEYAIEAVLAWDAGGSFNLETKEVTDEMGRVAANVTGSNRLLIGLGWSLVILIFWLKRRTVMDLRGALSLEITMLAIATALTLIIFITGQLYLVLAVVLIALYLFYLWASSRQSSEEPELMGPALLIGTLPAWQRRSTVALLFLYSAAVILVAAEPFVDALIETGDDLGIDEFILIQWIAPLASESPEIIVAVLFSLRANAMAGITTLISAEVNQLTVLIGSMAIIFSISASNSSGGLELLNFPLDDRQSAEFLLTSAVSAFAIVLIWRRRIHWYAGVTLLLLFVVQFPFTSSDGRIIFALIYALLSIAVIGVYVRDYLWSRRNLGVTAGPDAG